MFKQVVGICKRLLLYTPQASEARRYISGRLSKSAIDKYNIGYFPDDNNLYLLYDYLDKNTLKELKLIYPKQIQKRGYVEEEDRGFFNNHNLIFPFIEEYGNIIALAGRTLYSEEEREEKKISKYKNTFYKKSLHLFGMHRAKSAIEANNCAFVVEGQMDCIRCHINGYHHTVALTGVNLSIYQIYLLKKMTNKIFLLFDNDEAGDLAFEKAYKSYSGYINIERLKIPKEFKDVDQYLRESSECGVFNVC